MLVLKEVSYNIMSLLLENMLNIKNTIKYTIKYNTIKDTNSILTSHKYILQVLHDYKTKLKIISNLFSINMNFIIFGLEVT